MSPIWHRVSDVSGRNWCSAHSSHRLTTSRQGVRVDLFRGTSPSPIPVWSLSLRWVLVGQVWVALVWVRTVPDDMGIPIALKAIGVLIRGCLTLRGLLLLLRCPEAMNSRSTGYERQANREISWRSVVWSRPVAKLTTNLSCRISSLSGILSWTVASFSCMWMWMWLQPRREELVSMKETIWKS